MGGSVEGGVGVFTSEGRSASSAGVTSDGTASESGD